MPGSIKRALLALVLYAFFCPALPVEAQQSAPPLPAGAARVWFLRQYEPSESLRTPIIHVNGTPVAASEPGTIFYRDLSPGTYHFTVDSCSLDINQDTTLSLAAGMQVNLEVQSLKSFHSWGCEIAETFYIRPIDAARARMYLPQLAYLGRR